MTFREGLHKFIDTLDDVRLYKMECVLEAALANYLRGGSVDYKAEEDARIFLTQIHDCVVEELAARGEYWL